jgi:hypothetical protein
MEVISVVASGIKLGRCCLLMEVICAVASGIMHGLMEFWFLPNWGRCRCSYLLVVVGRTLLVLSVLALVLGLLGYRCFRLIQFRHYCSESS